MMRLFVLITFGSVLLVGVTSAVAASKPQVGSVYECKVSEDSIQQRIMLPNGVFYSEWFVTESGDRKLLRKDIARWREAPPDGTSFGAYNVFEKGRWVEISWPNERYSGDARELTVKLDAYSPFKCVLQAGGSERFISASQVAQREIEERKQQRALQGQQEKQRAVSARAAALTAVSRISDKLECSAIAQFAGKQMNDADKAMMHGLETEKRIGSVTPPSIWAGPRMQYENLTAHLSRTACAR